MAEKIHSTEGTHKQENLNEYSRPILSLKDIFNMPKKELQSVLKEIGVSEESLTEVEENSKTLKGVSFFPRLEETQVLQVLVAMSDGHHSEKIATIIDSIINPNGCNLKGKEDVLTNEIVKTVIKKVAPESLLSGITRNKHGKEFFSKRVLANPEGKINKLLEEIKRLTGLEPLNIFKDGKYPPAEHTMTEINASSAGKMIWELTVALKILLAYCNGSDLVDLERRFGDQNPYFANASITKDAQEAIKKAASKHTLLMSQGTSYM